MTPLNVIIAGAGLGGLAAAACLLRRGHRVRVYEQAPQLGEIGAGIQQSANSVKVLYDLGLKPALEKVAVRPRDYEFRRFDTGELMHKIPFSAEHEKNHGAPYYHLHRGDLHRILVDRVRSLDPGCVVLNAKATGFSEDAEKVRLHLGSETVEGDVLIGADGIKSVVRAQIAGDTPVKYTGFVAWRITVPRERLPADVMDLVGTLWCGPRNHCVTYWLRSGRLLNFVGCPKREAWEDESWTQRRPWQELKADYAGWHPSIQAMLDAADHNECYRWALNDRKPIHDWSTRRATLLGDAAHPTLPFLAQGACMAIEDGAIIARALGEAGSVPDALQLYQRARSARCARVVVESTEMGGLYHIRDAEEMKRAFAQRNIAKERAQWLYNYDPLTVPLQ